MRGRFNGRVIGQDYTGRNTRHNGRAGVYNAVQSAFAPSLDITLANGLGPLFTYTRATTATVTDFEGLIKSCLSGELRVQGARRVRNLRTSSQNSTGLTADKSGLGVNAAFTNNYAEAPDGTMTAMRLVLDCGSTGAGDSSQCYQSLGAAGVNSCWLKSNTGSSFVINGEYTNQTPLTVTTTWQRFSWVGVTSYFGFSNYGNIAGGVQVADVLVWGQQKEDTTGQSNQNPSEYVSVGVLSAPYHGYFVDGVKYFSYQNGNTVASNVVTEAQGAAITGTIGYLAEGARTNLCLQSQTFGTTWVPGSSASIVSNTAVAPDGTTTADSFVTTDTTSNAHVYQGFTPLTAAVHAESIYIKAGTTTAVTLFFATGGSALGASVPVNLSAGTVGAVTHYGASNDFTATITPAANGFYRVSLKGTTTAANWYFQLNGKEVGTCYLWGAQLEAASFASTYIPTTTAAVARNADVLTCPSAGILNGSSGAIIAEIAGNGSGSRWIVGDGSAAFYIQGGALTLYDGTADRTGNAITLSSTLQKVGVSYSGAACRTALAGVLSSSLSFDGDVGWAANFGIGCTTAGAAQLFGTIASLKIYRGAVSDAQLQALTS